jgi:hypothetical protein
MAKRIGPKMQMAVDLVRANPGTAILPIAKEIAPYGVHMYGYNAVHRAIRAGLIRAGRKPSGIYSLTVAE